MSSVSTNTAGMALQRQLQQVLAPHRGQKILVAFSGGRDSSVLLHSVAQSAQEADMRWLAAHIHHGLSPHASVWADFCAQQARSLGGQCLIHHLDANHLRQLAQTQGIEEAARDLRYAALIALAQQHQCSMVLTAHHQNDQAETVLLNLLRGAGLEGLSAMPLQSALTDQITLLRPWLNQPLTEIIEYQQRFQVPHIEDESNADPHFTRNRLRHHIMPLLAQHFAGYEKQLARTARHAGQAQRLLGDIAADDLVLARLPDGGLSRPVLQQLKADRLINLLRFWLQQQHVRAPSEARILAWVHQLMQAHERAHIQLVHENGAVRSFKEGVYWVPNLPVVEDPLTLIWSGQTTVYEPQWAGYWHFQPAADVPIQPVSLQVKPRQGGERLKLQQNRPTKSLKNWYEEQNVPLWHRQGPTLWLGDQLLYVAHLGMDCRAPAYLNSIKSMQYQAAGVAKIST